MINQLFDFGREGFLDGQISWSSNTIRAVLVNTAVYAFSKSTHQWLSDVPADARISTSSPLASKSITGGVAGAASVIFTGVTGPTCGAVILYKDGGTPSNSRLIAYITQANGLPVTPGGSDITINWDTDASKLIFKL